MSTISQVYCNASGTLKELLTPSKKTYTPSDIIAFNLTAYTNSYKVSDDTLGYKNLSQTFTSAGLTYNNYYQCSIYTNGSSTVGYAGIPNTDFSDAIYVSTIPITISVYCNKNISTCTINTGGPLVTGYQSTSYSYSSSQYIYSYSYTFAKAKRYPTQMFFFPVVKSTSSTASSATISEVRIQFTSNVTLSVNDDV